MIVDAVPYERLAYEALKEIYFEDMGLEPGPEASRAVLGRVDAKMREMVSDDDCMCVIGFEDGGRLQVERCDDGGYVVGTRVKFAGSVDDMPSCAKL